MLDQGAPDIPANEYAEVARQVADGMSVTKIADDWSVSVERVEQILAHTGAPEPDETPITTIAWRLGHLHFHFAGRWEWTFGERRQEPKLLVDFPVRRRGTRTVLATYAATKAGLAHLAEGIRIAMVGAKHLDIGVTTVYPGFIRSEISEQGRKPFLVDTAPGVRAIVEAIEWKSGNARVPAWPWRPLGTVMRLLPLRALRKLH